MPKGQGYAHGDSMYGGSKKSSAKSAYGNSKGGNYGKKIGDRGSKSSKGNRRTRVPSDRY